MTGPPPLPSQRKSSWWSRNWKWFVPVFVLGVAGLYLAFFAFLLSLMRRSDAYVLGVEQAKTHPTVIARLGEPVEEGWLFTGTVNLHNANGDAELSIPISGPAGRARIFVVATKDAGVWGFDHLVARFESDGQRIDLKAP